MERKSTYHELIEIIKSNKTLLSVFDALSDLGMDDYYVGAGAIVQSVWNRLEQKPMNYGISDIDVIYYDSENLEKSFEIDLEKRLCEKLPAIDLKIDVTNEAGVHLWYKEKNGYEIDQYRSCEDAIDSWPTTATSLGVRRTKDDWVIYAPFGLEDAFKRIIRANNRQITESIYLEKCRKWTSKWSTLAAVPWEDREIPFIKEKLVRLAEK